MCKHNEQVSIGYSLKSLFLICLIKVLMFVADRILSVKLFQIFGASYLRSLRSGSNVELYMCQT